MLFPLLDELFLGLEIVVQPHAGESEEGEGFEGEGLCVRDGGGGKEERVSEGERARER